MSDAVPVAKPPVAVRWAVAGSGVDILDQTLLPATERRRILRNVEEVVEAIVSMRVRGAPAIGIVAAMGLAVEMARHVDAPVATFRLRLEEVAGLLAGARPTAANLSWAVRRTERASAQAQSNGAAIEQMRDEATRILEEDRAMCRRIGEHALPLLAAEASVVTHCNAGALATGGIGTALAPVYLAHALGRRVHVFANETRPLLQGSRLTAWELQRAGIDVTVIPDSVAALLLRDGRADLVIVGADRIVGNGDVANKVGTYALAALAAFHKVPFYVAAPTSTFDRSLSDGEAIPIETRSADEVRRGFGRLTAPQDADVFAPAFDVTPAALVTAIITEQGILRPPYEAGIAGLTLGQPEAD